MKMINPPLKSDYENDDDDGNDDDDIVWLKIVKELGMLSNMPYKYVDIFCIRIFLADIFDFFSCMLSSISCYIFSLQKFDSTFCSISIRLLDCCLILFAS